MVSWEELLSGGDSRLIRLPQGEVLGTFREGMALLGGHLLTSLDLELAAGLIPHSCSL